MLHPERFVQLSILLMTERSRRHIETPRLHIHVDFTTFISHIVPVLVVVVSYPQNLLTTVRRESIYRTLDALYEEGLCILSEVVYVMFTHNHARFVIQYWSIVVNEHL